jgi:aminoglycoside 6'-N-acetyltransferase
MQPSGEDLLPREFRGGRLRRLRIADLPAFQSYRLLPELGRFQGWSPMSDAQALAFLAEMSEAPLFAPGQWIQLGIANPQTDRLVGDIGIYLSDDGRTSEIGFTLEPGTQGRGIATLAVREVLVVLLAGTQVQQIQAITDRRNQSSIRLLERVGFKLQETREVLFRGDPCSEGVYALPRSET